MSKRTQGPWVINQFGGQDKWAIGPSVSHRVCDVYGEANAHLIAAAPDLLAALREIVDDYSDRFDPDDPSTNPGIKLSIKQAHDAIVKATRSES